VSRPLIANKKRQPESSGFHKAVFARYGYVCILCKRANATDAAHVIGRAHLGSLRYADVRLARPLCRSCHVRVDENKIVWPKTVLRDATRAHNRIAKVPLPEPVR
jgi:hypothetical protein